MNRYFAEAFGPAISYRKSTVLLRRLVLITTLTYISGLTKGYAQTNAATEIVSLATEKCLDVRNGSLTSGADVRQYGCHEGANQKWLAPAQVQPDLCIL